MAQVGGANFGYYTDVIKVYAAGQTLETQPNDMLGAAKIYDRYRSTGNADIENLVIKGLTDGENNKVLVTWDPVGGVCSYVMEITKSDGTVILIDSDGTGSSIFGNNYALIPTEYVTLSENFSLRVKHKGGDFSHRYYYGAAGDDDYRYPAIKTDKYEYLAKINGVTNLYATSMKELGDIINYVVLYRPTADRNISYAPKTISGTSYKSFTFRFYPTFDLSKTYTNYPVELEVGEVSDDLVDIYKAVIGAQSAYCPSGVYRFDCTRESDGSYSVTVLIETGDETILTTDAVAHTAAGSAHYSATPYGSEYTDYAIDIRKKVRVTDSEQLFRAVSDGYGVAFGNDTVRVLYEHAKEVVYSIIGPEMTDYEKALAFYDYLATNVIYDSELAAMNPAEVNDLYNYAGFKLEGVFNYHQAVCDGISKAYLLLCAIEGIDCVRVVGTVNGNSHAWNKINIAGEWLVVDVTNGIINTNGKLYANHAYFAVSNEGYLDLFPSVEEYGEYPVSEEGQPYYDCATINGLSATVNNQTELDAIINSFGRAAGMEIEVRFHFSFAYGSEQIAARINAINNESENNISPNVMILGDDRAIITLV